MRDVDFMLELGPPGVGEVVDAAVVKFVVLMAMVVVVMVVVVVAAAAVVVVVVSGWGESFVDDVCDF